MKTGKVKGDEDGEKKHEQTKRDTLSDAVNSSKRTESIESSQNFFYQRSETVDWGARVDQVEHTQQHSDSLFRVPS